MGTHHTGSVIAHRTPIRVKEKGKDTEEKDIMGVDMEAKVITVAAKAARVTRIP